jgi:hypothetical protein
VPENAPIAIYDGEDTPVERTYTPKGISREGVATYRDDVTEDFPPGRGTISISLKENERVRRIPLNLRLSRVVTKTVDGVDFDAVADYGLSKVEFVVPVTWSTQLCDNLATLTANAINSALVRAYVEDGDQAY